jgi:DNA-binding transcriptional regulator GbsR (MarR family)
MTGEGIAATDTELSAEHIRREFALAWGEIGAAWGVTRSTASVQGYLLAHGGPLSEPEVRRALGLSHRAASLALAECEEWGLIERAPVARRIGQRGPAAAAWTPVGDHWEWFRRVTEVRKEREMDPVLPVIERCAALAREAAARNRGDRELARLRDRMRELRTYVLRFDHGVGAFVRGDPRDIERLFAAVDTLDQATIARLWRLVGDLEPDEMARALRALASLSPGAVRRLITLADQPVLLKLIGSR